MKVNSTYKREWIVSEEIYLSFLNISQDHNPLHTDDQFAVTHGFKEKVVHGNLLNVFLSYAIGEMLPVKNIVIVDQSIQYKNPVYIGLTLTFTLSLSEVIDSVMLNKFNFEFMNKDTNTQVASGKVTIKLLS